jgi:ABC-type branched-subunit amino acid transport system ATPase component
MTERRPDLSVEGVTVRFGGIVAVHDVSLAASAGTITGLIGPNGAGKTTTFNACTGRVRATEGRVRLGEQVLDGHGSANRASRGLGRTFQRMELFESLTVADNVRLGPEAWHSSRHPWGQFFSSRAETRDIATSAVEAIERCGITDIARNIVADLSTGQRRLVELARAIATPFTFLLLDEPSSGLDVSETVEFGTVLVDYVRDTGTGILLVEHDMDLVARVCSYIYVLDFGRLIYSGTCAETLASPLVKSAYLGEGLDEMANMIDEADDTVELPLLETAGGRHA